MNVQIQLSIAFLAGCLVAAIGCSRADKPGSQVLADVSPLESLNAQQQIQKQSAIEAKTKLFQSLVGELTSSIGEKGPAKSIGVCKTRAPEIARTVSQELGATIGRTSFKLRNDQNAAPSWAAEFVEDRIEKAVEVELPEKSLGVLLPIHIKANCLTCHGPREQIASDVRTAISTNYPLDDAYGFSEGDLRGYFWVEVPTNRVSE